MIKAPIPENEAERISELERYSVLDSEREEAFDEIAKLAAITCNVPTSFISFIDTDRQWFKSTVGFDLKEIPRDLSYCSHTILSDEVMIVSDDHPLLSNFPNVKFYAGAPLISKKGLRIGALCVFNEVSHKISTEQIETLRLLAKQVMNLLELRLNNEEILKVNYQFQQVQKLTKTGGWEVDISTGERFVSEEIYRILQVPFDYDFGPYNQFNFIDEKYRPQLFKSFELMMKTGNAFNTELSINDYFGNRKWISIIGTPIYDKAGKISKVTGTIQDLTQKKVFEDKLRESELQHRTLFDQSVDAITTLNPPYWSFSKVNAAALKLFGAETFDELNKLGPLDLSPQYQPDGTLSSDKAKDAVETALHLGSYSFEWEHLKLNGEVMYCTVLLSRITSKDHTYIQSTIRDITQQRKAELELLESKRDFMLSHQLLNLALEGANLGIWDWDLTTNRVTYDKRWLSQLGLSIDDVQMEISDWESRVHPDDLSKWRKSFLDCLDGKISFYENTQRLKHKDGRWVHVLSRGRVSEWNDQGKPTRFTGTHFDITGLKKLEGELVEAQSIAKIGSWSYDLINQNVVWSEEHYKIFEIEAPQSRENLFRLYRERIHPEDLIKLDEFISRARRTGEGFTYDHRVVLDDGKRVKFVQGIAKISFNEEGQAVSLSGTCRDRTLDVERDDQYKKLIDTMNEGFILLNQQGDFIQFNESALEILEVTREELLTRDCYHPEWHPIHEDGSPFPPDTQPAMVCLKTGKAVSGVTMGLKYSADEIKWIRINAVPLEWHDGRRVLVTFSDITALIIANEENKFILDTLGIGLWNYDMITNKQHWDHSMYKLYGLTPEDFQGDLSAWRNLLTKESKDIVNSDWERVLNGERELYSTYEVITKNGTKKYIGSRSKVLFNKKNQPIKMYGINWDRTTEAELEKSYQQERAKALHNSKLASIGQLAAGVGHEINNPLAIISGQTAVAEQLIRSGSPQEMIIDRFKKIDVAVNRIANIVKGLRTFARSDDNQIVDFNGNELVKETVEMLQDLFRREETNLVLNATVSDFIIHGNRGRLQQLMVNLITNAKDATIGKENRKIIVETSLLKGELLLTVSDNGSGIPESIREKIFEPFFTTKDVNKGTGIGLSLVNTIVKEHNGKIALDSVVGEGTTFKIFIPAKVVEQVAVASESNVMFEKLNLKVLIVDDEEDLRDSLKFTMQAITNHVHVAKDAIEALEMLKNIPIDVIFSDVKMPGIDGFKFLDLLRGNTSLQQPKFLFITGGVDVNPEQYTKLEKLTHGFLPKPFKKDLIYKKLLEISEDERVPKAS